ncbi:metal-binding protein [Candidatus Poribacteria bacterium]|nr:MAG: metal-binding protein [Candidatus Poribacteria bacterium]
MAEVQCALCEAKACTGDIGRTPSFCPRRNAGEALERAEEIRSTDPEVQKIASVAKSIEQEGYRVWPRVRELIEFSKRMGLKKIGIAFCVGLKEETAQLVKILKSHGFEVSSVACTVNGGCNPVGQAMVLNQLKTELNVIMGLCMGHDVLFTKFSEAPVTTLVVKDRVTCHNPGAPLINRYWRDTFLKAEKK